MILNGLTVKAAFQSNKNAENMSDETPLIPNFYGDSHEKILECC